MSEQSNEREQDVAVVDEPIAFHRPVVELGDVESVVNTLRSGWLSTGPKARELETLLGQYLNAQVVCVSSATSALQLLYRAAGVGPGDEVITTPFTFVATAEVAIHLGAKPVFVDVEDDTGNIDPSKIEAAITERTKAIVPVHFAGQLCAMDEILELANRYGIAVVEDAAHALSSHHGERKAGMDTFGAALSFYATKELSLGEGGAIVTQDPEVAQRVRSWALHGMTRTGWSRAGSGRPATYDVCDFGYKMNLPDVLAALGVGQVPQLDRRRAARERLARIYDRELEGIAGVRPLRVRPGMVSSCHLYCIRVDPVQAGMHRDRLVEELSARGIQTSVHFTPLHGMTAFRQEFGTKLEDYPVATRWGSQVLSLPLYPGLTVEQVRRVANEIRKIVQG